MHEDDLPVPGAGLSAAKRALLEKRLRGGLARSGESESGPKRSGRTEAPLSITQQRLWSLIQSNDSHSLYMAAPVRLTGWLDLAALEKSLFEIVRRHESLRTTFRVVGNQLLQVVSPAQPRKLIVADLSHLSDTERDTEIRRSLSEAIEKPFDPERGPLMRVSVMRLGEQEHVVVLVIHHMISDAWSMNVLTKEIAVLYEAYSMGKVSPLADLPIQYIDFALWQRQQLESDQLNPHLNFWVRNLSSRNLVMKLPTASPRPDAQSFRGAYESLILKSNLSESVRALARRENVTLYMMLLAVFKALLYCHTKQEQITVGSGVAGRDRIETEGLIGCFINTLVLSTDVNGELTFRELLDRVRRMAQDAFAHQFVPFEKLVEVLSSNLERGYPPLVQVLFDLRGASTTEAKEVKVEGLKLMALDIGDDEANADLPFFFDLALSVIDSGNGFVTVAKYNPDLFDKTYIAGMLQHFSMLLNIAVTNPEQRIADFAQLLPSSD